MPICPKCGLQPVHRHSYCRECKNEYMRDWYRQKSMAEEDIIERKKYRMISSAKKRAAKLNLEFNISAEDITIPKICPVLGIKLELNNKHIDNNSPTLDMICPLKGYIKNNIQVISCRANRIKSDATSYEVGKVYKWMKSIGI